MNRRAWTRRESSRVVARTDSPIKTLARAPPRAPRERRRIERATSIAAIRRHARATPFARAPTLDALDALDATREPWRLGHDRAVRRRARRARNRARGLTKGDDDVDDS